MIKNLKPQNQPNSLRRWGVGEGEGASIEFYTVHLRPIISRNEPPSLLRSITLSHSSLSFFPFFFFLFSFFCTRYALQPPTHMTDSGRRKSRCCGTLAPLRGHRGGEGCLSGLKWEEPRPRRLMSLTLGGKSTVRSPGPVGLTCITLGRGGIEFIWLPD
jgi:hypothetical protein